MKHSHLARLAGLAYNPQSEGLRDYIADLGYDYDRTTFIDCAGTELILMNDGQNTVVTFRGTEPTHLEDWAADLDCACIQHQFGRVHRGFTNAYLSVADEIRAYLDEFWSTDEDWYFVGHSLGGALATLCVADCIKRGYVTGLNLVTFGSPRVGNSQFARRVESEVTVRRYVNNNDVVPKCPFIGYRHVGKPLYFDRNGKLHDNSSLLFRKYDGIIGRTQDVGTLGTDGIKDHNLQTYRLLLERHESQMS